MSATYRTIALKGTPIVKELPTTGTPLPGMLAEVYLNTVANFRAHSVAGGNATCALYLEDENQGKQTSDAYVAANIARVGYFRPGDEVAALIYANETVVIGTYLESQGNGYFRALDVDPPSYSTSEGVILQALEAFSGSSAYLIKCLVL
jgi:hypothetical protein